MGTTNLQSLGLGLPPLKPPAAFGTVRNCPLVPVPRGPPGDGSDDAKLTGDLVE